MNGSFSLFQVRSPWDRAFDIVLVSSLLVFVYITFHFVRKLKINCPPGPVGLPIVGYIPFLEKYAHIQFKQLGKKYGDVFSLQLGSRFVVVLNTAEAIREGCAKPEFLGRPKYSSFEFTKNICPFFKSENNVWSEHRKVFLRTMKDLGYGKSRVEKQIQDEIANFLAVLRTCEGRPVDPQIPLTPSVANNISALVFNEALDYEHPDRIALDKNLKLITDALGQTAWRIFFPWLQYLPFPLSINSSSKVKQASVESGVIYRKKIEQHKDTLDPENIRDYIDTYLLEMKSVMEKNKNTTLSDTALLGSMGEIQGAGSETTGNTILWCIYTVAAFPDVQKRIREEIADRIGPDRRPDYADSKGMPYTQAVIMEVMRWKTVAAIPVLRSTTEDTTLRGYHIPKDTILMSNVWHAHNDPNHWSKPDLFEPERFLSEDGLHVKKSPNFMPFSVGKRACPGQTLANIEVFLYLASILQSFEVSFPRGTMPTFEGELTLNYKPRPYVVHFVSKNVCHR